MYCIQLNYGTVHKPDWRQYGPLYLTLEQAVKVRDRYFSNTSSAAVRIVKLTKGENP